jgi:hypothetical protein
MHPGEDVVSAVKRTVDLAQHVEKCRIDLGLGRAPGGDFKHDAALRRDIMPSGDDFRLLLEEL